MPTVVSPARHRSFVRSIYTRTDIPGTNVYSSTNGDVNFVRSDSRTTNYNKDWRQLLAKGVNVSSAYDRLSHIYLPISGFAGGHGKASASASYQSYLDYRFAWDPSSHLLDTDDVVLRDLALVRLKRKLAKHNAQFNLVVPVAELGEMRGLIRTLAGSASKLVKALVELKRKRGRRAYDYASEAWLTFSFGVSPLLGDVRALSEAIANYIASNQHTVRLTGSSDKTWFQGVSPGGSSGLFGANFHRNYRIVHQLSYRYTAGFDVNIKSANNYGLGAQLGLEFGSLIPAAWELVPYSWVADYFGTVGDYLEDVFTSPSGDTRYVVLNRRYTAKMDLSGELRPNTSTDFVDYQYFKPGFYDYFHFSRTPLSSLPHVALRFKTVDEIGKNAVNKLLNLNALLTIKDRNRFLKELAESREMRRRTLKGGVF